MTWLWFEAVEQHALRGQYDQRFIAVLGNAQAALDVIEFALVLGQGLGIAIDQQAHGQGPQAQ